MRHLAIVVAQAKNGDLREKVSNRLHIGAEGLRTGNVLQGSNESVPSCKKVITGNDEPFMLAEF